MFNEKTAKLIKFEETYPDNANSPTNIYIYQCPCGNGTVEYGAVPGFDDRYALLHCRECSKKYKLVTGCGSLWELIPDNKQ